MDLFQLIKDKFDSPAADPASYSPLALAFIGDAVCELVVRSAVIGQGNRQPHKLQRDSARFSNATAQKQMITELLPYLTPEEASVFRRGRNAHPGSTAKHATVGDYHKATGFEAVIGWLYVTGQTERLLNLIHAGWEVVEHGKMHQMDGEASAPASVAEADKTER
ncbi:MAG: hypothetical protein LUE29_05640 [Lachnospiraceae bacterium]|nr:hypothetical protein [Lachnospiraceae bacterium]